MKKKSPPHLMIQMIALVIGSEIAIVNNNFLIVSLKKKPNV